MHAAYWNTALAALDPKLTFRCWDTQRKMSALETVGFVNRGFFVTLDTDSTGIVVA